MLLCGYVKTAFVYLCRASFSALAPQMDKFADSQPSLPVEAVIITVRSQVEETAGDVPGKSSSYDYLCRFFSPWFGLDEDPVAGKIQGSHFKQVTCDMSGCGEICLRL